MEKKAIFLSLTLIISTFIGIRGAEPSITFIADQYRFGGFMPQCISINGRYVAGSSFVGVGFIADWQSGITLPCHGEEGNPRAGTFNYITNDGVGLSGRLIHFDTGNAEWSGFGGFVDMMTEDGSIAVGMTPKKEYSDFGSPHNIEYQACYWEDGEMHLLPIPTEQELGYYYLRTRARCISSDGSVILGEIIDRLYQLPMILWYRQEDGSYKADPVCMEYFSDIKYNEGYYKEYVTFRGHALSRNGKWVAMTVRESPAYNEPAQGPLVVALYNVETGEITKTTVSENFREAISPRYEIYYNGIADDGTIVGYYNNNYSGLSAFIMHPEDMILRNFIEEFDTIDAFADFDKEGHNKVSSITPDGRYIVGYGFKDDYIGYVLDCGDTQENEENAVGATFDESEAEPSYFDLSGRRIPAPAQGVTIVRYPDGSSKKIIR